jgi:hypothetical protein
MNDVIGTPSVLAHHCSIFTPVRSTTPLNFKSSVWKKARVSAGVFGRV